jgi:metallo-beta-lactamase family protein
VLHHLKQVIEDERSTVLIVGYQAPNTLGRRLVDRLPEVRILGRLFPVKAEVVVLNGLSSHADHGDMLRELRPLAGVAERVRLVHGEPDRAERLATGLREIGFTDVAAPERGESVVV